MDVIYALGVTLGAPTASGHPRDLRVDDGCDDPALTSASTRGTHTLLDRVAHDLVPSRRDDVGEGQYGCSVVFFKNSHLCFPDEARWDSVIKLLEPLVAADDKRNVCSLIVGLPRPLPQHVRTTLAEHIEKTAVASPGFPLNADVGGTPGRARHRC